MGPKLKGIPLFKFRRFRDDEAKAPTLSRTAETARSLQLPIIGIWKKKLQLNLARRL